MRVVHQISSNCNISIEQLGQDHVRIRITEQNSESPSPADFEIEGYPDSILDALTSVALILTNLDSLSRNPC
jgi:hypothetical protein